MKQLLALLCVLTGLTWAVPVYPLRFVDQTPVLDGQVQGEKLWDELPEAGDFKVFKTLEKAKRKTSFKAFLNAEGLWIGIMCEEPGKVEMSHKDMEALWDDDCAELFVGTCGTVYRHYVVNLAENRFNAGSVGNEQDNGRLWQWKAQAFRTTNDWSMEVFIPSWLLDGFQYQKLDIGFNLGRHSTSANELSSWAGQRHSFHNRGGFGILRFDGRVPDAVRQRKVLSVEARERRKLLEKLEWEVKRRLASDDPLIQSGARSVQEDLINLRILELKELQRHVKNIRKNWQNIENDHHKSLTNHIVDMVKKHQGGK